MRVAILGAKGFLGSYLTEHLIHNHFIIPVTRDTVDLTNFTAVDTWLRKEQPDVVINCAISGGGTTVNDINYSDVQRNLQVFFNFYNSTHSFKYINVGSGAEFDKRTGITAVAESDLIAYTPIDSYGYSKNIIARAVLGRDNFYTLRLFGCFDSSEPSIRLFKKFKQTGYVKVDDKQFDFISAEDFGRIVEYYCRTDTALFKDINCVYQDKLMLSEQLKLFARHHVPNGLIDVTRKQGLDYTGSGRNLAELKIPLRGLLQGIKDYE